MKTTYRNIIPSVAAGLAAAALLPAGPARAELFQAPFGPGGTWRIYETFPGETITFKEALEKARALESPVNAAIKGDLVSITSREKEIFISRTVNRLAGDTWIGLIDRVDVAEGAEESQAFGTVDEANRKNGWKFTNGDTYSYYNWNPGEPNDAGGAEDAVHFGGGGWNDNRSGYADSEPSAAAGSTDETNTDRIFRYVVEYAVNSPTPLPGIRRGMLFPPDAVLPTPPNTAGNWSIREYRGRTLMGNVIDAFDEAISGDPSVTFTDGMAPYLDFADPFNSGNGGPILTTPPRPFLTDTPDVDDNDIVVTARTRIKITTAGDYTIQVRSDDGFGLRIKGQAWKSVAGAGYIDPLDPTTMIYELGTGDANTRGVVTLAVGEYDVDFVYWEGGGGASYEVTSATGARPNAAEAQWLPFGSTDTIPEINSVNAVYMTAAAQVDNANLRDRGNVLPAMRAIIEGAIANGSAQFALRPNLELNEGPDQSIAFDADDITRFPFNNGQVNAENVAFADNFIQKIEGGLVVAADADGNGTTGETIDITFGLFCDDGASMRILGQDFEKTGSLTAGQNVTLTDVGGDMTLTADFYTGNTNAYGLIKLKEGQTYPFVCYMYEGGGGANFNLRWELGDLTGGFTGGQTPLRTEAHAGAPEAVSLTADAKVTGSTNAWDALPVLPGARAVLEEAIAQIPRDAGNSGTRTILVLRENGEGSISGRAFAGAAQFMPVGAVDNYATKVKGRLKVDNQNGVAGEAVELTFAIFADDGADFHILGQDFTGVSGANVTLTDIGGDDSLTADFFTGNTNAFGHITLTEGEYDFEGHHYEGGGGSGYEVWWSLGTRTAVGEGDFRPLNTTPGFFLPGNTGIELVAAAVTPPSESLELTNFTYAPTTGAYSLTFGSTAGSTYQVEYTIGFEAAGAPASPQKWNTVPSLSAVAGAAGSTTVSGNISEILAPGGQLPNNSKAFFRVKRP